MCKVYRQGIFSESVSPQTMFASCNQLILARCQIIQAERRFRSQLFSAEKFDVIKLSRLVNQVATGRDRTHSQTVFSHPPVVTVRAVFTAYGVVYPRIMSTDLDDLRLMTSFGGCQVMGQPVAKGFFVSPLIIRGFRGAVSCSQEASMPWRP